MKAYSKINGVETQVNIRKYNGNMMFTVEDLKGIIRTMKLSELHMKNGDNFLFDKGQIVKKCKTCGEVKEWNFDNFYKDKKLNDGTASHCKVCVAKKQREGIARRKKTKIQHEIPKEIVVKEDPHNIHVIYKNIKEERERVELLYTESLYETTNLKIELDTVTKNHSVLSDIVMELNMTT